LRKHRDQPSEPASRRQDGLLTTGEMARQSGSTPRTVRFYEEAGLIRPASRSAGGHRLFPRAALARLQLVIELRAADFSLEDIRDLLDTKLKRKTGREAAGVILEHLDARAAQIRTRIALLRDLLAELVATREVLHGCTACGGHPNYPECCNDCERLAALEQIPGAAGVLWHLREVTSR
jgi:DNA-binding transcriptional MerR regulator